MKRNTKLIVSTVILFSLVVLITVVMLAALKQPSKKSPISTLGSENISNSQEVYPFPRSAIVQQPVYQQGVYPPPPTTGVQPSSAAVAGKAELYPTTGTGTLSVEDVQRTTQQDAKSAFDGNKALFLDVRSSQSFTSSHVPGAISIPESLISERIKELDPNQWIIAYCS